MQATMRLSFFRTNTAYRIDADAKILRDVEIIRVGDARGHGETIDLQFVQDTVVLGNAAIKGVKCRFGHPNDCASEPLGTFLGKRPRVCRLND
jgi:hypothetical protein